LLIFPVLSEAKIITFDEYFYQPGFDMESNLSEVNRWYSEYFSVYADNQNPRRPSNETSFIYNSDYQTNVLAPGGRRGRISGILEITFNDLMAEVMGAISLSGGAQPGVRVTAYDSAGHLIDTNFNDLSNDPFEYDFRFQSSSGIARVLFWSTNTYGYGLDTIEFHGVSEPLVGGLVSFGLLFLILGRRKKRLQRLAPAALAIFMSLNYSVVEAALIDYGAYTEDSATGLKWLDLTATMGYSVNDILGGAGGFRDAGYRHATVAEVYQLFEHGGIVDFSPGISMGNNEAVIGLQSLLGITKKAKADGQFFSLGFHGLNEPHDGLVAGYAYQAQLYYQSLTAGSGASVNINPYAFDYVDGDAGHFLVLQVFESSWFSLLSVGVLSLISVRFSRLSASLLVVAF
jgi:hypothetical protein